VGRWTCGKGSALHLSLFLRPPDPSRFGSPSDDERRRPRRGGQAGALAVSLGVACVAGAFAAAPSAFFPARGAGAVVPAAPHGLPTLTSHRGPPGWQPVDWGLARLWVPGGWSIDSSSEQECSTTAGGVVFVGSETESDVARMCRLRFPPAVVTMRDLAGRAGAREGRRKINGIAVLVAPAPRARLVTVRIPAFGVEITLTGPVPAAVLASLGPSPIGIVFGAGPVARPGAHWKSVTYGGLTARVPGSWPVVNGDHADEGGECGGFQLDGEVLLGPDSTPIAVYCPSQPDNYAGLWLKPAKGFYGVPGDAVTLRAPAGASLRAYPDYLDFGPPVSLWYGRVSIRLGLGAAPQVARAIFDSLRATPGRADTRGAGACPTGPAPAMPEPRRLASPLSLVPALGPGGGYLQPAQPASSPKISAAPIWREFEKAFGPPRPYERYEVLLAEYQGELVWAVYGIPFHTVAGDCGEYYLYLSDADTGAGILNA